MERTWEPGYTYEVEVGHHCAISCPVLRSAQHIVRMSLAFIVTYPEGMHKDSNVLVHTACQEPAPILHSATQALQGPVRHWLGMYKIHVSSNPVQPPLDRRLAGKYALSCDDGVNASSPRPQGENATPARELIITILLRQWQSDYPKTSSRCGESIKGQILPIRMLRCAR